MSNSCGHFSILGKSHRYNFLTVQNNHTAGEMNHNAKYHKETQSSIHKLVGEKTKCVMMMEGLKGVNILNIFSTLARNEAATLRKGMSAPEIR